MEAKQALSLVVGRRISTMLYGRGMGTIVAVHGEEAPASVRSLGGGVVMMGGRCEVDIVFDGGQQSRRLPECIARGVQWTLYDEIVGAEAVAEAIARAAGYEAAAKAKADAAKAAFERAKDAARAEGVALGLVPADEFKGRGLPAAANLRAELKKAGIRARVKADGYSAIRVRVEDRSQAEAADEIGRKYKAGSFDGMSDCYEYSPCAWGSVFGDVRYVFVD